MVNENELKIFETVEMMKMKKTVLWIIRQINKCRMILKLKIKVFSQGLHRKSHLFSIKKNISIFIFNFCLTHRSHI